MNTVKKQQQMSDVLENGVEIMKQLKRKTLIITGLKVNENEDTEQAAMRLMKDKLKVNLHPMDIHSLYSAKKKTADSTPDVVITLTTTSKKIEVMRSKKNLRHHDDKIYINEQLTQRQGELYASTRSLAKRTLIHTTWTRDGEVL